MMKKNITAYRLLPLIIILLIGNTSYAQGIYKIDTQYPVHDIDGYLKVYFDSIESKTPETILKDSSSNYKIGKELPRMLVGKELMWGKIDLVSENSLLGWTLNLNNIFVGFPAWTMSNGKVDVFAYANEDLIFHKKTGPGYGRRERDIAENWVINRVKLDEIPLNIQVTLVIRAEGNIFGYPPFFRLNLRAPSQSFNHEIFEFNNAFNLFMFGVTFIILLYHILQYIYLRESIFLYFSLWLFFCCMTMFMAVGGILDLVYIYGFTFWMFFANSIYFVFWFFGRSFIQSKEKFPLLDKLILALAFMLIIEIGIVILMVTFTSINPQLLGVGYHYKIMVAVGSLGLLLSIVIANRKDNFARYFGMGAIIGQIFLTIGSSWSAGLIGFPGFDPYAWGMFAQIVIFSFGIAYRQQVLNRKSYENEISALDSLSEVQRVKDLAEIKTKFFANISHEFRTPLTLISGPLSQAEKENQGSNSSEVKMRKQSFEIVKKNADRLQTLVNQLLDLSKLENSHVHLSLTSGSLMQFIRSVVFSYESMAERKSINFNSNFSKEIEYAFFDKDKLEKIISNLISNAFKYTPKNGSISISVTTEDHFFTFEIIDSGKGINKNDMDKIFERFYRVEGSEEKGTGIGLALVKELVNLHNGFINVSSTIGEGTSFKIRLPYTLKYLPENRHILNENEVIHDRQQSVEPIEYGTKVDQPSTSIILNDRPLALIVEDNEDLRTYISEIISKEYEVIKAVDGNQGERMAFEHIPDIIISDVMMPKKDGYQLCNSLKKNQKTSHIPIIMLTAKAGQQNKIDGLSQGADAYLTKPFQAEELLIRMKNLLETRKRMWEQFQSLDLSLVKDMSLKSMDDLFFQEVIHVIKENLDNELLSVEDLAREVGFSRSQLHRKLKAITNKSANQLIVEMRLNEAKRMLEQKTGTVSEIAFSVGYSSLPYFTKSFKKQFGTLPSKVFEKANL